MNIAKVLVALFCMLLATFAHGDDELIAAIPRATRTAEEQKTIDVYKSANQAVVFITTRTYMVDPFAFFDEVRPQEGTGTGTIIDGEKGIVITNLHVIEGALGSGGSVEIMLANGRSLPAKLIGYDSKSDIAALRLAKVPSGLKGIPYGNSSALEVGQRVLAIGNPFGLYRSLTTGIISSLDRSMKTAGGAVLKNLIQTDAAINPGNSGGPLLDADGRLIGINTAILSQSGDSAGVGFAVPINTIKRILPELLTTGRVRHVQMEWQLVDTDQGPMVSRVKPGGVAESAGVRPIERIFSSGAFVRGYRRDIENADLIYTIEGERVHSRDEVEGKLSGIERGQKVTMTLRTGGVYGRERRVSVVPKWE